MKGLLIIESISSSTSNKKISETEMLYQLIKVNQ